MTPEEKHRNLLLEQVKAKDILDAEMGNNGYLAITKDTIYIVTIGISSGQFFGKKVKSYQLNTITGVEIGKKILTDYIEINAAGMGGKNYSHTGYTDFNENRVFFNKMKTKRFVELADKIRKLMHSQKSASKDNSVEEIEKLHELYKKGILTKEEFEKKKKKLLDI